VFDPPTEHAREGTQTFRHLPVGCRLLQIAGDQFLAIKTEYASLVLVVARAFGKGEGQDRNLGLARNN
jgi:hypothetical protein